MDNLEALMKAKIPCKETGIEIKHTLCCICSPSNHCGVNAYVKDGKLLKVEGTDDHPKNHGLLCTKGASNREFIYREDRILTPLRRVGERGEGKFEPISWDEAYKEIAEKLLGFREKYGADSVAFYGGYNKWYRPWLRRFAHSFGTMNYGTESSTCMTAKWIAWNLCAGRLASPDMANCDLFLGWAYNPYYSKYLNGKPADDAKKKGTKFIIVDPKITPAVEKLADLHLRPRVGTDGALALCMANVLIQNGWIDKEFIDKHVYGFEKYAEYVKGFNETNIEELTGVPFDQVMKACEMIHESKSMAINETSAPIPHHINGTNNYRSIISLSALTGNYDHKGGQRPIKHTYTHQVSGFSTREEIFGDETEPKEHKTCVGADKFPLWYHMEREMQVCDLGRQILEEKPYPIHALFAMGLNYRMIPGDLEFEKAMKKLDFFVDTDLFMTDSAKYADIVLPVCSSFERGQFMTYAKGYAWYTNQVIDRVGESRSDAEILCDLAKIMDVDDKLKEGYEENIRWIIQDLDITVEQLRGSETPVHVPGAGQPPFGTYLSQGLDTPTGKFELSSKLLEDNPKWGLDPLPVYVSPLGNADEKEYPFVLCSGGRKPNMLHSRLHKVPWLRSMTPDPTADVSLEDAKELGLTEGDTIELYTSENTITVKVNPTSRVCKGEIFMPHGYTEADVNSLIPYDFLDPYSGFPGYNSFRCGMRKKEAEH